MLSLVTSPAINARPHLRNTTLPIARARPRTMLVSLTVGKVDAGVAVLLTEDKRLVRSLTAPMRLSSLLATLLSAAQPSQMPAYACF